MGRSKRRGAAHGEITVFLSMILLLILSLVGTFLESARVSVARRYGDGALQSGVRSLFTEYALPLWEDYHIFLLEGREEGGEEDAWAGTLRDYMEDALSPDGDGERERERGILLGRPSMQLLSMETERVEVKEVERITDGDGESFLRQAAEYSKYRVGDDFFSEGKEGMEALKEVNSAAKVVEEQLRAEEKMAKVNEKALSFLTAVEGVSTNRAGIRQKRGGYVRTEKYFVKKFCPGGITKAQAGITNDTVWRSLRGSYVNPVTELGKLETEARRIKAKLRQAERAMEAGKDPPEVSYAKIDRLQESLARKCEGVMEQIGRAMDLLGELREEQGVFEEEALRLEDAYEKERGNLSQGLMDAFEGEIRDLRGYADLEGGSGDSFLARIFRMEPYLEEDRELAAELLDVTGLFVGSSPEEAQDYLDQVGDAKEDLRGYRTRQLVFDYSSLLLKGEAENPLEAFRKGCGGGLLGLVLEDPSQVSKKKRQGAQGSSLSDMGEAFLDGLKGCADGFQEKVGESLEDFGKECDGKGWLERAAKEKVEESLFSCYVSEHFACFADEGSAESGDGGSGGSAGAGRGDGGSGGSAGAGRGDGGSGGFAGTASSGARGGESASARGAGAAEGEMTAKEKEKVLDYEQEYLLMGKSSDKANLSATVGRIVLLRSLSNYLSLLTDREKTQKAYSTAALVVGCLGMEPLVCLTKNLILFAWGAEEAIVDAGGLLQGKRLSWMKAPGDFAISYEELLKFGRPFVQEKIGRLSDGGSHAAGYGSYVRLFLSFQGRKEKARRAMDEVEANIRLRYDGDFSMSQGICGMEAEASFVLGEKFLRLPFALGVGKGSRFSFASEGSYRY